MTNFYYDNNIYDNMTTDEIVWELMEKEENMKRSLGRDLNEEETKDLWGSYLYMRKENKMK